MHDQTKDQPARATADVPALIPHAGDDAVRAYREFLADPARTRGTRRVYRHQIRRFLRWAEGKGLALEALDGAAWAEFSAGLTPVAARAIRTAVAMLFAHLAAAGALPANPFPPGRPERQTDPDGPIPLAEMKQAVREIDPTWEEDSEFFRAGLVVLSPAAIRTMDPAAIAAYTGVPEPEVREYADRLLANRIWRPDGTVNLDPDDPAGWGTEFIVHALVAIGHVECRPTERGDAIVPGPTGAEAEPSDGA